MRPAIHGFADVATVSVSSLLLRDRKFFAKSTASAPLVEVAAGVEANVEDVRTAGRKDVVVDTPLGQFEAAYMPWQWLGPEYPTLIYHHGSGERPFDFVRFGSNSFRRLFVGLDERVPANLVAVQAPFHGGSSTEYARGMGEMENFVGMLAASVGLFEALVTRLDELTGGPVVTAGISLGGWAVNLHRATVDSADHYVPLFAGTSVADVFLSSVYRKLTAESARRRPDRLREILDFREAFQAVEADDCSPLLGRYDRIIELDVQRPGYEGMALSITDTGHVTGALATGTLREHVREALRTVDA